jgi:hypothetical protein
MSTPLARNIPADLAPPSLMRAILTSSFLVQALHVVATLGVADQLAAGPLTSDELAQRVGAKADPLRRVLRALAAAGIFALKGNHVELTPLAATLRTDVRGSVNGMASILGAEFLWRAWGDLLHTVRTGETAFQHVHGRKFFNFVLEHPDLMAKFNHWMVETAAIQAEAILAAYDFSAFRSLADIGGGHGGLLREILRRHPSLKAVLFDMPAVVAAAPDLGEYVAKIGGSFFDEVPRGMDAYVLKYILHDWGDEDCVRILTNCRRAMADRAKIVVIDMIVPPGDYWHYSKLSDLTMLVLNHGGRERTRAEFEGLFERVGLSVERVVPTKGELSVIVGCVR